MTTKIILLVALLIIVISITPLFFIKDKITLNSQEMLCAKRETKLLLDNPIERILVRKITIDNKDTDTDIITTSAYTISGIKYAKANVVCEETLSDAKVIWRLFFGYNK